MKENKISVDAFPLKVVALLFMLLDHIDSYMHAFPAWVSLIPRFVAPLFVYFLVEGFFHTSSRKKYAFRLYIVGIIMWIGNICINYAFHNVNRMTGQYDLFSLIEGHNIIWTFAIFFTIMILIDNCRKQHGMISLLSGAAAVVLGLFSLAGTEGGLYLLPVLLICYFLYGHKMKVSVGILIWCLILFAKAIFNYVSGGADDSLWSTLCFDNEWMMAAVIIPISLYSGRRGNNSPAAKWMFYIFYPAHLWILMILSYVFIR